MRVRSMVLATMMTGLATLVPASARAGQFVEFGRMEISMDTQLIATLVGDDNGQITDYQVRYEVVDGKRYAIFFGPRRR
ncbi:hypothetical protein [Catellatospora tritici]|uniref:hypothetical protein n=1 Tax=Catellatospora tritici TaxID=2851566 RepID=UPI001C2CDBF6|nr:hypothetical protein [Catellatospora tritici]MBV1856363.1 hypothetical protein [Catellatospora tritici]